MNLWHTALGLSATEEEHARVRILLSLKRVWNLFRLAYLFRCLFPLVDGTGLLFQPRTVAAFFCLPSWCSPFAVMHSTEWWILMTHPKSHSSYYFFSFRNSAISLYSSCWNSMRKKSRNLTRVSNERYSLWETNYRKTRNKNVQYRNEGEMKKRNQNKRMDKSTRTEVHGREEMWS